MGSNANAIRSMIEHENELINHRMTWFLILQGFMLTGLAFAWEKNCALCGVFSFIGALSSISVGVILFLGSQTIERLESQSEGDDLVIGRGADDTHALLKLLLPWHLLPVVFLLGWLAIFGIKLFSWLIALYR